MFSKNQTVMPFVILMLILLQIEPNFSSKINGHLENSSKKTGHSLSSGIIHRLKRNPKEDFGLGNLYYNPNKDEFVAELIQENPWATITSIPEVQKRQLNYTPRLGRDIGEENTQFMPNSDRWLQESELAIVPDVRPVRSYYVPRLGRRSYQYGKYL